MSKQSICIFGGGLTAITTALILSKLNLSIDLIDKNFYKDRSSLRSLALSNKNYDFLNKFLNLKLNKVSWPIKAMQLFEDRENKNFKNILNFQKKNSKENILYMLTSDQIFRELKKKIKSSKNIKIKNKLDSKKFFNLIINCNNHIDKKLNYYKLKKNIKSEYNQVALTMILKHKTIKKNNITRQIFCEEGPIALLPISEKKTSIVWSIYKKNFDEKKLKEKIKNNCRNFFLIDQFSKIEYRNLYFTTARYYYDERVLNFGDILHQIHPFAGQGFNMTLRDLAELNRILKDKIKLGLDIGDKSALNEFENNRKSKNFVFAEGIDLLNKTFYSKNYIVKKFRDFSINKINKDILTKNFFLKLADDGLNF